MSTILETVRRGDPLTEVPFIDVHCHFGPWLQTTVAGATDMDAVIAAMDRYGCDIAWMCASGAGWSNDMQRQNDQVFALAARYPQRILPYCTLSSLAPDQAMGELERCLQRGPCIGLKMHRGNQPPYTLRDAWLQPVLAALNERRLVFMNHQYPDLAELEWAAQTYPQLCFLSGHGVYRDINDLACTLPNVKECTCAAQSNREVEREIQRLGRADTMLVGSDFTIFHLGFGIGMVAYADLTETDKRAMLGGNAIALIERAGLGQAVELQRLRQR